MQIWSFSVLYFKRERYHYVYKSRVHTSLEGVGANTPRSIYRLCNSHNLLTDETRSAKRPKIARTKRNNYFNLCPNVRIVGEIVFSCNALKNATPQYFFDLMECISLEKQSSQWTMSQWVCNLYGAYWSQREGKNSDECRWNMFFSFT